MNTAPSVPSRKTATAIGIFILTAYGVLASEFTDSRTVVMVADVISGLSVIGIAVLIFPMFKALTKTWTYSYLFFRLIEGILMIIAGVAFLSEANEWIRDWVYTGPHVWAFIAGGYIFYTMLYKSKVIPRFISVWGMVAVTSLLLTSTLDLLQVNYPEALQFLLVLIITNEVFLAIWLMVKGFKPMTIEPAPSVRS